MGPAAACAGRCRTDRLQSGRARSGDRRRLGGRPDEPVSAHTGAAGGAHHRARLARAARADGWEESNGQWQHEAGDESYDDGDWVYLGDGVWEDAYVASLPTDARRDLLGRYANAPRWNSRCHPTRGDQRSTRETDRDH